MKFRCPICHAETSLEAAFEDESARELMGLLGGLPREVSAPLVAYLGLWRSRTRALSWERALRIAREALAEHTDQALLGAALSETVEAIRRKREEGEDTRPLRSHHYLRRVLESLASRGTDAAALPAQRSAPAARSQPRGSQAGGSRTAQALHDLEEWRHGE